MRTEASIKRISRFPSNFSIFSGYLYVIALLHRSSRPEVFCKKGVPRNFAIFTGKDLCQSVFFRPATLLKKRLWHTCFPVNSAKFLRTPFFTEHLRWLLRIIASINIYISMDIIYWQHGYLYINYIIFQHQFFWCF